MAHRPIQIVSSDNHTFKLQNLNDLERILKSTELNDRHVVVVSIAGALRQGKSFLLNFFLRYLNAQYKKHNVKDWIGRNKSDKTVDGFEWRGGKERNTIGIWIWSEVFIHDFSRDDKVAIILMDTQGIFDNKTTLAECISIFAVSMLLSSVQCYNVMRQVKENDLTNLQLFMEYAQFAMEDIDEKPFQKLLFIVRDWPSPFDHEFGPSKEYVKDLLAKNEEQKPEMQELRDEIEKVFHDIDSFLMPYPGNDVAQQKDDASKAVIMDSEFIDCVEKLTEKIFAPKNLIRKKVGGEVLAATKFLQYLKEYVNVFQGKELPEPKTVLQGTSRVYLETLIEQFLNEYVNKMLIDFPSFCNPKTIENYYDSSKLLQKHQKESNETMKRFKEKRKFGDSKLQSEYMGMLERNINEKYTYFHEENEKKKPEGGCTIL